MKDILDRKSNPGKGVEARAHHAVFRDWEEGWWGWCKHAQWGPPSAKRGDQGGG